MLALQSITEMHRREFGKAADMIVKNNYVDDLIQSVPSVDEAICLAEQVQDILQRGGFQIKHWIMSGDKVPQTKQEMNILNVSKEKILGRSMLDSKG